MNFSAVRSDLEGDEQEQEQVRLTDSRALSPSQAMS